MELFLWFIPYILIAIEIGLLAGTVGSYIYMRGLSVIVGGLSHFMLGPLGLAYLIGTLIGYEINFSLLNAVFMIAVAFLLPIDSNGKVRASNDIQVLWSVGMAFGLLIIFLLPEYINLDLFLFGSILTISTENIIVISIVTVLVLLIEFMFHNRFKYLGLDDDFLILRGISPYLYHRLQLVIIVLTIVVLLESIGILLLIAVLIIPAASTSLFVSESRALVWVSMFIATMGLILGIIFSYIFDVQISSISTLILGGVYCIARIFSKKRYRPHNI